MKNYCASCGYKLEAGKIFCPNCGKKIDFKEKIENKKFCVDCGMKISENEIYCDKCKAKNQEREQEPTSEVKEEEPNNTEQAKNEEPPMPQAPPPQPAVQEVTPAPVALQPTPPQPELTTTPKVTKTRSKVKIGAAIGAVVIAVMLILIAMFTGILPSPGENNLGQNVPVLSGSVNYNGGTISFSDSSSPLNGLGIEIPNGATSEEIDFNIGYKDINSLSNLPEEAAVASKMITINTDGSSNWDEYKSFEKPVKVTLPYDKSLVSSDEVVRFYYYDESSKKLDAAGFLSQDETDGTITFYTGTFSSFVAIKLNMAADEILGYDYSIDTGFRPKTDGWFIANYGSYLETGGICLGMTTYAKWYYAHKKPVTNVGLYGKYMDGDFGEWRDDETAIELATRADIGSSGIWSSLNEEEKNWSKTKSEDVAISLIHGMKVSGEPQLTGLKVMKNDGTLVRGGHAVLTYSYSNGRFEIYDPNYPGTDPGTDARQIPFTYFGGFTRSYSSGQNAGDGRQYNIFYHAGIKTFSPLNAFKELYDSAEKDFQDDTIFPTVTLTSPDTPIDTDGDGIRDTNQNTVTISGTITGGQKEVDSTLIFVSNEKFIAPVANGMFMHEVPLYAGNNDIIILATDENTRSKWAGFHRDTIKCTASEASLTFTLTWGQYDSDVDLHVLEPTINGVGGRHIYFANMGEETRYVNPFLDIDNTDGYGPEHYYATNDMTLPNYQDSGKSLYGTYKFRVHYYYDWDEDDTYTQLITWRVHVKYLAFRDEATGTDYWEEGSWSGSLTYYEDFGEDSFSTGGYAWSPIYEVEYLQPDPDDYDIPPPPQNELPG